MPVAKEEIELDVIFVTGVEVSFPGINSRRGAEEHDSKESQLYSPLELRERSVKQKRGVGSDVARSEKYCRQPKY